jgi:hypothetical protein
MKAASLALEITDKHAPRRQHAMPSVAKTPFTVASWERNPQNQRTSKLMHKLVLIP